MRYMEKLDSMTTHSIPRKIIENELYSTLQGILDKAPGGGTMLGILCATIAIISDEEILEDILTGSKFRYGDNVIVKELSPSLFYAANRLEPSKTSSKSELSNFIDHKLIPTGAEKIISSRYDVLLDLFIQTLEL